jgi:hypothetical protein
MLGQVALFWKVCSLLNQVDDVSVSDRGQHVFVRPRERSVRGQWLGKPSSDPVKFLLSCGVMMMRVARHDIDLFVVAMYHL